MSQYLNWLENIGDPVKNQLKTLLGELSAKVGGFRGKHRLLRQIERFIGSDELLTVNRRKVWWELNTKEWIHFSLFWDGQYAGGVSDLLARVVERSSDAGGGVTLWDVGANIGAVSLPLLARFPTLSVEAFEPAPGPLGQLKRHLAMNPTLATRLRLHTLALSDEKGEQAFYQSAQTENQAIGSLAAMGDTQPNAIQVTCALGDDLIDAVAAARPSLIKIDVEGCELKVLLGLKRTL